MKRLVRLSENDLHMIIKESVNRVLNEESWRKAKKKVKRDRISASKNVNKNNKNNGADKFDSIDDSLIAKEALMKRIFPDHLPPKRFMPKN